MSKKDLWRTEGCNLLTDVRYFNAKNNEERNRITNIICKECDYTNCMFAGKDC